MRKYVLVQRRHARIEMRGLTLEERLATGAKELLAWKRATILGLRRKFPQVNIDGFEGDGVLVTLPTDSPEYLRVLRRELDCEWGLAQGEKPQDLRDLLFRGTK